MEGFGLLIFIIFRALIGLVLLPIIFLMWIGYSAFGYHPSWNGDYGSTLAEQIIDQHRDSDECLSIRYIGFEILPGFDAEPLSTNSLQYTCLGAVARGRLEPMACAKKFKNSQCLYDVASKILEKNFPLKNDFPDGSRIVCRELYTKRPITVQCEHYTNSSVSASLEFPEDQCVKFFDPFDREWCNQYRAIRTKDVAMCEKISSPNLREECYYQTDETCNKSSLPELREACEARKIIGK